MGIAPLYVFTDGAGQRHLFPLGIAMTDRIDALALPGYELEVAQAIAAHIESIADAWDCMELPQLAPGSLLLHCRWWTSWRCELDDAAPNPVLALPARLPPALAKATAEGATHFDFLRGGEPYKYRWGAVDEPMFRLTLRR